MIDRLLREGVDTHRRSDDGGDVKDNTHDRVQIENHENSGDEVGHKPDLENQSLECEGSKR